MTEEKILSPREQAILRLLAKLRTLSTNFENKKRDEILFESEGTELSPSILNICRAFSKSTPFTDRNLFMLNYIASSLKRSPADCAIVRLLVNEPYIAETYKDMMSKRAVLDPDYKTPCNLARLLSLGSEAVSCGSPRSYSATDVSVFAGNDSPSKRINCALKGYFSAGSDHSVYVRKDMPKRKSQKARTCPAAIIYTRDAEKAAAFEEFFKRPSSTHGASSVFACEPERIFGRLLKYGYGFTINADLLPEVNLLPNMPADYRALIKTSLAFFDRVIFGNTVVVITAPASRLNKLCSLAKDEGFSVCRAVKFTTSKEVTVTTHNSSVSTLGLTLLSSIRDMIGHLAQIQTHDTDSLKKATSIEKVYEDAKGETAVYRTEINVSRSPAPYHEALYAATGLIISSLADGFDLKNGDMHFSANASLSLKTPKDTGAAIAAILGFYRAETEFCVTEENSSIDHSDSDSTLTLYLRAHSAHRSAKAKDYSSIDPILFSKLDENGLPAFEEMREFAYARRTPRIIWRRKE